jgi:SAM-dependent methyltransferase
MAQRWLNELNIELCESFKKLDAIEHWRCRSTGFEWYWPKEAAGDSSLYAQLQKFDWYYMPEKWEFDVALKVFNSVEQILEVGIGFGHFLSAARRKGILATGVELNAVAAARAREAGFTVYEDDLELLESRLGDRFDGVCAFQVLEHVPEPMPFLRGMLGMLRPGGKLVISVPNAAVMRVVDPDGQGLLDQPPHHVTKWDEKVFKSLEKYLYVNIISMKREPLQPYHIGWFAGAIGRRVRRAVGDSFGRWLVNRYTLRMADRLLRLGVRRFIPGHTLLVVMEKRV